MQQDDAPIRNAHDSPGAHDHCAIAWQRFSPQHPALPGHFPGRPIIPGVVLLQHVHALLQRHWPQQALRSLPVVKFVRPVLPNELLLFGIEPANQTAQGLQYRFVCRCGTQTVAYGTLLAPAAGTT